MRFLLLTGFALYAVTAAAQLYSWRDAEGKVHYSDQPPPSKADTRKLVPTPAPASDPNSLRKNFAEKQMDAKAGQKDAQDKAAKAEKERIEANEKRENCERARTSLQSVESGQTRFTIGKDGERVALDGATRETELANARKSVDSWCK